MSEFLTRKSRSYGLIKPSSATCPAEFLSNEFALLIHPAVTYTAGGPRTGLTSYSPVYGVGEAGIGFVLDGIYEWSYPKNTPSFTDDGWDVFSYLFVFKVISGSFVDEFFQVRAFADRIRIALASNGGDIDFRITSDASQYEWTSDGDGGVSTFYSIGDTLAIGCTYNGGEQKAYYELHNITQGTHLSGIDESVPAPTYNTGLGGNLGCDRIDTLIHVAVVDKSCWGVDRLKHLVHQNPFGILRPANPYTHVYVPGTTPPTSAGLEYLVRKSRSYGQQRPIGHFSNAWASHPIFKGLVWGAYITEKYSDKVGAIHAGGQGYLGRSGLTIDGYEKGGLIHYGSAGYSLRDRNYSFIANTSGANRTEATFVWSGYFDPSSWTTSDNYAITATWAGVTNGLMMWFDGTASSSGRTKTISWAPSTADLAHRVEGTTNLIPSAGYYTVIGTYKAGSHIKLFVNGVLDAANTSSTPVELYEATTAITIGQTSNASAYWYLAGRTDAFFFLERSLSDEEAIWLSANPFAPLQQSNPYMHVYVPGSGSSPTSYSMDAAYGVLNYTGYGAALTQALQLLAAQGSYSLTGYDANLLRGLELIATQGSYSVIGYDAAIPVSKVLSAAYATFALTGYDAALTKTILMEALQGSYGLTGYAAETLADKILAAAQASYALTGVDAALAKTILMDALGGAYSLTGYDTEYLLALIMQALTGTYAMAGQDAAVLANRLLSAAQASYTLSGIDATFAVGIALAAELGSYSVTGNTASLLADRVLELAHGAYTLAGFDASIARLVTITAATGSYTVTGYSAQTIADKVLSGEFGVYTLTGRAAALSYNADTSGILDEIVHITVELTTGKEYTFAVVRTKDFTVER